MHTTSTPFFSFSSFSVLPQFLVLSSARNSMASACPSAMVCTVRAAPVWFFMALTYCTMVLQHSSLGLTTLPRDSLPRRSVFSICPSLVMTWGTPQLSP